MAPNVTITPHEATIDEINREAGAAQWTDDPDALRRTVNRLAEIGRELAEQVDSHEQERQWDRRHPWLSILDWSPWLFAYIAGTCMAVSLAIGFGWQPAEESAWHAGIVGVLAAGGLAGVNALVKRAVRRG